MVVSISLMNLVTAVTVEGSVKQASEDDELRKDVDRLKKQQIVPCIRKLFKSLDADDSGEVSLQEILNAPAEMKEQLQSFVGNYTLPQLFRFIDRDMNSKLDIDEVVDALSKCSEAGGLQEFQTECILRALDSISRKILVNGV